MELCSMCYVAAWMAGEFGREWIHVYVWLSHFAVHLKPSQQCSPAILQYKINFLIKKIFFKLLMLMFWSPTKLNIFLGRTSWIPTLKDSALPAHPWQNKAAGSSACLSSIQFFTAGREKGSSQKTTRICHCRILKLNQLSNTKVQFQSDLFRYCFPRHL